MTGANRFIADFDRRAHAAFADAGLADIAGYTNPAGAAAGTRQVYLDAIGQTLGEWEQIRGARTAIGVVLASGPVEAGGTLTLGARTYTLQRIDERDAGDGSVQWWVAA